MSPDRETVPCLLCGSAEQGPTYREWPNIVRCKACGFVYTSPRPTREALAAVYTHDYFENNQSQQLGYDNYVADRELVQRTFVRRLAEIERRWAPARGRLLDVGCALGFFLTVARERGWRPEGAEISAWAADYARRQLGLEVHVGAFCEQRELAPGLDLVTMWDYIEHSSVPDEDLAQAYALLKPGGVLAITTPDVASWPARVFRAKWMGFKDHEHLYYFSTANLCELLERKGFRVVDARHVGKYVSLGFFAKRASMYADRAGRLFGAAASALQLAERSLYVNPFDIVKIIAVK
jgi:2-polyprenyl-3-methyl-5-hydroxy-6-metoxy-1,4-benzoquinol methylase